MKGRKITSVGILHYLRLAYRAALFLCATVLYILKRVSLQKPLTAWLQRPSVFLIFMWLIFAVEMIFRFFPSRYESPGCQKQFRRNYIKTGKTDYTIQDNHGTVLIALLWLVMNGIFGILHSFGIFDDGIMLLLCSAYSVCDMICILFFCPFQSWFLQNKCCCTCRIYNWDYAMMFTPLLFVRSLYTWSLLALSVILLFRWEITFYRHPERFAEETNGYLTCANCTEKLCHHKTQLHSLWKDVRKRTKAKMEKLTKKE